MCSGQTLRAPAQNSSKHIEIVVNLLEVVFIRKVVGLTLVMGK